MSDYNTITEIIQDTISGELKWKVEKSNKGNFERITFTSMNGKVILKKITIDGESEYVLIEGGAKRRRRRLDCLEQEIWNQNPEVNGIEFF